MSVRIDSEAFFAEWHNGTVNNALVGVEPELLVQRLAEAETEFRAIIDEKKAVSGGDDWHDGAFRATDNAALTVVERVESLRQAEQWPVVEIPSVDFGRITLGSRALIGMGVTSFPVEVVGLRILHQTRGVYDDQGIEVVTLDSDLGKHIFGRKEGEEFEATLAGRKRSIKVISVAPSPDLTEGTIE